VTDHIWSVAELIERTTQTLATPPAAPTLPCDPKIGLLAERKPFTLLVAVESWAAG